MIAIIKLIAGFLVGKIAARLYMEGYYGVGVGLALSIIGTLIVCALIDKSLTNG